MPGDIAVLLRSPRGRAELFRQALDEQGIEAFTRAEGGFLTTREIASMLCLLRALRNPTLDIELIGAMLFLVDERAASFVTGIVLPVDGGYSAFSGV